MPSRTMTPFANPAAAFATGTTAAPAAPVGSYQMLPGSTLPTSPTSLQGSTRGAAFPASPAMPSTSATATSPSSNTQLGSYSVMANNQTLPGPPLQSPGNNLVNQGYTEQAVEHAQNRLLNDPFSQQMQDAYAGTVNPTQGEQYLNQNLGTLQGPGQGDQYWNQVQGQFMDPFAGEQFARQATQAMAPQGPASAFNTQAQQQYQDFTGYQGPGNTQGQYGQSSAQLAGGTQGEQGLGQIAGQYDQIGQYSGQNNAANQYGANASSGPLAGQAFYDSVAGQAGTTGRYSDPNLAAGQYGQTQQAFGDLPIANFDPFYDRASQLATQNYERQAAGRGVYGSSEALSGVGNIITDIEAQRANRSFDAEMQRAIEQRNRQALLGEQARMGDLSSLAGFGANLAGLETFGNLANAAGNQTLGQQTMLGNQARQADVSATDAFNANLAGAQTFGNLNEAQGRLELDRNQVLGNMANAADSQALGAQQANISGLNAMGNIAGQADTAETNRYQATTNAMNQADRTGLDRMGLGADVAFRSDDSNRADYLAEAGVAANAANLDLNRTRTGAEIADRASGNDLDRLDSFMSASGMAEDDRQGRMNAQIGATERYGADVQRTVEAGLAAFNSGDTKAWEDYYNAEIQPMLQAAGYDQQQQDAVRKDANLLIEIVKSGKGG